MLHIEDIEELCEAYPSTKVLMDHFGFCRPSDRGGEPWKRLLGLARFSQVGPRPKVTINSTAKQGKIQNNR